MKASLYCYPYDLNTYFSILPSYFETSTYNNDIMYINVYNTQLYLTFHKNDVKVLDSICQQIWKIQQWPKVWKRSFFIPIPKKDNAKKCSNYHTTALIAHASKVMLKILQARLQQYVNHELPDVQTGFRKGRGTRDQIANIRWIMEKAREFQQKHLFLLY